MHSEDRRRGGMKSYTAPELTYKKLSDEKIFTASGKTDAEKQVSEKMTGTDYGIDKKNITVVNW